MGMVKEKPAQPAAAGQQSQELTDAYEAIAALYEQVGSLTAQIQTLKGGNS